MKILISNDDGWDAEGLEALCEAAASLGEIWVVAPAEPQSGSSHRLTLNRPLHLVERRERFFSLDGTPADCARVGLTQLGVEFDWMLSGINHGANLGSDVFVSGTVAAAREATLHGVPAIALSQYRNGLDAPFDWADTGRMAGELLGRLLASPPAHTELINVNFPDPQERVENGSVDVVPCELDLSPLPADYRRCEEGRLHYHGRYQNRPRLPGRDVDICFSGKIAITRIQHGPPGTERA